MDKRTWLNFGPSPIESNQMDIQTEDPVLSELVQKFKKSRRVFALEFYIENWEEYRKAAKELYDFLRCSPKMAKISQSHNFVWAITKERFVCSHDIGFEYLGCMILGAISYLNITCSTENREDFDTSLEKLEAVILELNTIKREINSRDYYLPNIFQSKAVSTLCVMSLCIRQMLSFFDVFDQLSLERSMDEEVVEKSIAPKFKYIVSIYLGLYELKKMFAYGVAHLKEIDFNISHSVFYYIDEKINEARIMVRFLSLFISRINRLHNCKVVSKCIYDFDCDIQYASFSKKCAILRDITQKYIEKLDLRFKDGAFRALEIHSASAGVEDNLEAYIKKEKIEKVMLL
jgi:hypothetical protein